MYCKYILFSIHIVASCLQCFHFLLLQASTDLFACIVRLPNLHKNKVVLPYFTCGRVHGAVGTRCQQIMK